MARGGANGGSQYNPNKISPMGGDGQSGKMAEKAMQLRPSGGGAYGATTALTQQIEQGGNVKTTAPAVASANISMGMRGAPVTPITEPTQLQEEPIQAGTAMPGGVGPEGLMLPQPQQGDKNFNNSIQAYAQPLEYIASLPNTSQETRNTIALLLRQTAE